MNQNAHILKYYRVTLHNYQAIYPPLGYWYSMYCTINRIKAKILYYKKLQHQHSYSYNYQDKKVKYLAVPIKT